MNEHERWEPPDDEYWEDFFSSRPVKSRNRQKQQRKKNWPRITRDGVIFSTGLIGVIYETVIHDGDPRDTLLILFATMIGLPAFLRMDDKREQSSSQGSRDESR